MKSFPIVAYHDQTKEASQYYDILRKVEHLYKVRWEVEIIFMIFLAATFVTGCFTRIAVLSILCHAFAQVVTGWMGHSMAHSRDKTLNQVGRVFASLVGGFSLEWWSPKHNMHHIFTNSQLYDDDIKHDYKVYLYPFLYLKWRYDSLMSAFACKNLVIIYFYSVGHC